MAPQRSPNSAGPHKTQSDAKKAETLFFQDISAFIRQHGIVNWWPTSNHKLNPTN